MRSDLSIIPRNTFYGESFQTLDLRVSKDIPLAGSLKATLMAEVFNTFNSARYRYNTLEPSPTFGLPNASGGQPRTGQLAFKLSF